MYILKRKQCLVRYREEKVMYQKGCFSLKRDGIDGIENKCPTDRNSQGTCKHVFLQGPPVPLFCPVGRKYQPILQDYWVKSVSKVGLKSCANPWPFSLFQPPNDPHGIQREDLILSLRAVLASTPRFAEVSLAKVRYVASAQRRL